MPEDIRDGLEELRAELVELQGSPVTTAFDRFFLSVRPDYMIEIRPDVMLERDGPMLKHGLQGMDGQRIQLPTRTALRPSPELLEQRHRRFLELAN